MSEITQGFRFAVGDRVNWSRRPGVPFRVICSGPRKARDGEARWYGLAAPEGEGQHLRRAMDAWECDLVVADA